MGEELLGLGANGWAESGFGFGHGLASCGLLMTTAPSHL